MPKDPIGGKCENVMHLIAAPNLRTVDLNLLVVFDTLMAERSVTRAASLNGLSQPAVSRALNRLRHLFDDPLFVRRDRAMEPTERALELAGPIHGALADISRTLTVRPEFDPATARATVKIATIDLYHTRLLPLLVRRLRREATGIRLEIESTDCSRMHEELATGQIDIAFAPLVVKLSEEYAEPLWSDRLVTLVSKDNRLCEPLTLESFAAAGHLVDAGHVQVSRDGTGTSVVDAILAARGMRRRIVLVLPNSAGVPFVVSATDLIATLPSRVVQGLAPVANVRILAAPLPDIEVRPHMFWHRRTRTDPLRAWLRTAINEIAAQL